MSKRSLAIIGLLLALVAAACGDDAVSPTAAEAAATATQAPQTSTPTSAANDTAPTTQATATPGASTTVPGATTAPATEGPAAPDFSLDLADGSQFVLSDEQQPVYLVFWAEW